jgi:hypothetical protein
MATEKLRVYDHDGISTEFEVEYRRMTHIYGRLLDADDKCYEVFIGGEAVGRVQQRKVSTSRSPRTSRVRYGIGSHMEWGWARYPTEASQQHRYNTPGLYGATRRAAVADMLGYSRYRVEVVK